MFFLTRLGTKSSSIKSFFVLQKKSLHITYFRNRNTHKSPLFRLSNILKLPDKIAVKNALFINKHFNKFLPTILKNWLTLSSEFHICNTCWSNMDCFVMPTQYTKLYGCNSVDISAICT